MEENTTKSEVEPDNSKEATDGKVVVEQVWAESSYLVAAHMVGLNHKKWSALSVKSGHKFRKQSEQNEEINDFFPRFKL